MDDAAHSTPDGVSGCRAPNPLLGLAVVATAAIGVIFAAICWAA